jgi:murein DD-endopeptidase MepM/ murein hydrolase activator NlpD
VDRDFVDWDPASEQAALDAAIVLGYTPDETLDRIRGRQVWIDHGRHVVTRYAHLDTVADLRVGETVTRGQVIGRVGSSGFEEGGPHLHFEIRVGDDYLGDWLEGDELVRVITRAFD